MGLIVQGHVPGCWWYRNPTKHFWDRIGPGLFVVWPGLRAYLTCTDRQTDRTQIALFHCIIVECWKLYSLADREAVRLADRHTDRQSHRQSGTYYTCSHNMNLKTMIDWIIGLWSLAGLGTRNLGSESDNRAFVTGNFQFRHRSICKVTFHYHKIIRVGLAPYSGHMDSAKYCIMTNLSILSPNKFYHIL